jgi:1-acyl-sn-glycerol-3-phosphate acyltransferase
VTLAVTPPMAVWQIFAMSTGLLSDRRVPRAWHRMVVWLLGLRIHVRGEISPRRPLLIASNHISWIDIVALGSLADLHFVSKSELANWPIISTFARFQRTVFVERTARRKSREQAGEIARRLEAGDPMVLFAEGSSGDGNLMLPFKSTLFAAAQMALEPGAVAGVFIQPVAIAYTRLHGVPMGRAHRPVAAWIGDQTLLPHIGEVVVHGAIDVEISFGEPVEFGPRSSRKEVARKVEAEVRGMMLAALRDPAPRK